MSVRVAHSEYGLLQWGHESNHGLDIFFQGGKYIPMVDQVGRLLMTLNNRPLAPRETSILDMVGHPDTYEIHCQFDYLFFLLQFRSVPVRVTLCREINILQCKQKEGSLL